MCVYSFLLFVVFVVRSLMFVVDMLPLVVRCLFFVCFFVCCLVFVFVVCGLICVVCFFVCCCLSRSWFVVCRASLTCRRFGVRCLFFV